MSGRFPDNEGTSPLHPANPFVRAPKTARMRILALFAHPPTSAGSKFISNSNTYRTTRQTDRTVMIKRTYKDAVNALNTLQTNFAAIQASRKAGTKRDPMLIPEMVEWTRRIGYHQADLDRLHVVHVTGTKGKGSTCAFVSGILSQYQHKPNSPITRIGLYTSPHLKSVRERIMIDGQPISEGQFARYFFEVWDRLESSSSDHARFPFMGPEIKPAYFRYLTLMAFHAFLSEGVDTAVVEVGIGGEYDSTNIVPHPTACGIAALGLDHTDILGNTLESIAWNKSGIFKPGAACFSVRQPDAAATQMIAARAVEKHAASFSWVDVRPDVRGLKLGINGEFQAQNASLAVALCAAHLQKLGALKKTTEKPGKIAPATLPPEFVTGLTTTHWPGRCQVLPDRLRSDLTWFIDGAHTKESIQGATHWFTTITNPAHSRVLYFNQQKRGPKQLLTTMDGELKKADVKFGHAVFSANVTWASGKYSADQISLNTSEAQVDALALQKEGAQIWSGFEPECKNSIFHDIQSSIDYIRKLPGPIDVFVTGSLHLLGGFLIVLEKEEGKMGDGLKD